MNLIGIRGVERKNGRDDPPVNYLSIVMLFFFVGILFRLRSVFFLFRGLLRRSFLSLSLVYEAHNTK